MIQLSGPEGTAEFEAARALRDAIVAHWPSVATDEAHEVHVIASACCHGQAVRDVDVLVLARLGAGLTYDTFLPFQDASGNPLTPRGVEVRSLCVALEVKDHPLGRVRFQGTRVQVHFDETGWKDATEQSFRQTHSVRRYLRANGLAEPRVANLIWLREVPSTALPRHPHNVLGARPTWEHVLNVVAQHVWPRREGGRFYLRALPAQDTGALQGAAALFTRVVVPTRLDRLRVERLNQATDALRPLLKVLGKRMLLLRGRGGTGKTMRLLQLANHLAETAGQRVLMLTYNRALVADVRRLLTIMGMRDEMSGGTIHIRTVHGFVHAVLAHLGIIDPGQEDFLSRYEELKDEALEYLRGGAVTEEELTRLSERDPYTFGWSAVLVDEGQDWPDNERELLVRLFGHDRLAVADGMEQMVRTTRQADWQGGSAAGKVEVVPLGRTLRMKSVPARFATAVAARLGLLQHAWSPNAELPGGRVVVIEGDYFGTRAFHDRLVAQAVEDGNRPVDMLFCAPPANPGRRPAERLAAWGALCWDGTQDDVREGYPTDTEQLRVVYYESCRGLEGWTVVNLGMDRFYAHRLTLAHGEHPGDPDRARQDAARWIMIPLTRAIDTLIIQLDGIGDSALRAALRGAADECGDSVEWLAPSPLGAT